MARGGQDKSMETTFNKTTPPQGSTKRSDIRHKLVKAILAKVRNDLALLPPQQGREPYQLINVCGSAHNQVPARVERVRKLSQRVLRLALGVDRDPPHIRLVQVVQKRPKVPEIAVTLHDTAALLQGAYDGLDAVNQAGRGRAKVKCLRVVPRELSHLIRISLAHVRPHDSARDNLELAAMQEHSVHPNLRHALGFVKPLEPREHVSEGRLETLVRDHPQSLSV